MKTLLERAEMKIERIPFGGCWIWMGALYPKGYSSIWKNPRSYLGHRIMYEEKYGKIPDGLELDHLCRNRCCVNPDHLEAVTHKINLLRGEGFSAKQARQTHCMRGHELSGANLRINGGNRMCVFCRKESNKRNRKIKAAMRIK